MEDLILAQLLFHMNLEIKDSVCSRNVGGGEIVIMKN